MQDAGLLGAAQRVSDLQRGGGLSFFDEQLPESGVAHRPRLENLERDPPLQPGIARFVDDRYSPFADLLADFIMRQDLSADGRVDAGKIHALVMLREERFDLPADFGIPAGSLQ